MTAALFDAAGAAYGKPATSTVEVAGEGRDCRGDFGAGGESAQVVGGRLRIFIKLLLTVKDRGGQRAGSDPAKRGIPPGGDQGRTLSDQRASAILVKGVNRHEHSEETAKFVPVRIHDQRYPAHEAVQCECGAHLATIRMIAGVVRPVRPLRHLRAGRGQHRMPSLRQ